MDQTSFFEEESQDEPPHSHLLDGHVVSVLVPYPVDKAYDYIVPPDITVQAGDYVSVPLGNREIPAVVWGEASGDVKPKKLKAVISKYDLDPMPEVHRKFIDWVANYTVSMKGSVLKMALSAPAGLTPSKPARGFRRNTDQAVPPKLTPQRQKVLEAMSDGQTRIASEIADIAGCSAGVVSGMADKGLLEEVSVYNPAPCLNPNPEGFLAELSEDQQMVADELCDDVKSGTFSASLVDGVTGAGKTEVYFEAVAQALKAGKQVVIMLPEIALSNAFLERFKTRFGCAPALWHSHLNTCTKTHGMARRGAGRYARGGRCAFGIVPTL